MRIFSTAILTATFLGSFINYGWSPGPADLKAPIFGSRGATGVDVYTSPKPVPWEYSRLNPENMTRTERLQILQRERAAGRVTNEQEKQNFLATGNPYKALVLPDPKPPVKPRTMSDAQWQRYLAVRPKQENYVKGSTDYGPGLRQLGVEGDAARKGGRVVETPGAPKNSGPPVKTTTSAPTQPATSQYGSAAARSMDETNKLNQQSKRYNPVTSLGVHRSTQSQPGAWLPSSAAMDRLGGGPGVTAPSGSKPTSARTGAALLSPSTDKFRQPK